MTAACLVFGYVGPGGLLSAIATFAALLAAAGLAAFGFVWYPIKRALAALRSWLRRDAPQGPAP